jgi:hypothetical protein
MLTHLCFTVALPTLKNHHLLPASTPLLQPLWRRVRLWPPLPLRLICRLFITYLIIRSIITATAAAAATTTVRLRRPASHRRRAVIAAM